MENHGYSVRLAEEAQPSTTQPGRGGLGGVLYRFHMGSGPDWPKDDGSSKPYLSRTSPLLFSQYLLLVGGPFIYLLGVAQAVLPGIASSIVGILTRLPL